MFRVGDKVICKPDCSRYSLTNPAVICKIVSINRDANTMRVKIFKIKNVELFNRINLCGVEGIPKSCFARDYKVDMDDFRLYEMGGEWD